MTDANEQDPNGEKAAELPEPFRYTANNPIPESPRGKLARAGQQIPKDEKPEDQPEPLHYSVIEPPAESPRGKLAQPGQKNPKDEKTEEEPEPVHYAIVEPPPPPPDFLTEANLPDPLNASADANGRTPTQAPAIGSPPVAKPPIAGSQKSASNRT